MRLRPDQMTFSALLAACLVACSGGTPAGGVDAASGTDASGRAGTGGEGGAGGTDGGGGGGGSGGSSADAGKGEAGGADAHPPFDSPPVPSTGNALASVAAAMSPGSFALLNHDGDASGYNRDLVDGLTPQNTGVGTVFAYAQKATYDPVTDKVFFKGAP